MDRMDLGALRGRQLLERTGVVENRCDLDLLLFFARHPRSLLSTEQIAKFIGYDLKQLAASLEALVSAGIVTRIQGPARVSQLFVFTPGTIDGGSLPALMEFASTREGRISLMQALAADRDDEGRLRSFGAPSREVVGG